MTFPPVDRVLYDQNPIDGVICQIRFPAILKVDSEPPAAFQERIRGHYPLYTFKTTTVHVPGLPPSLGEMLAKEMPIGNRNAHEFQSKDANWTLSLTRDFLALTCQSYTRWEQFVERLGDAMSAFAETYSPAFYTRIGLRYRDVIRRTKLSLQDDCPWNELLQPWIIGPLSTEIVPDVEHSFGELVVRLNADGAKVRIQSGLVFATETNEQCFLIDMDLFDDKQSEINDVTGRLDFLHQNAHAIFRWCVKD